MPRYLTKSRFNTALDCPTKLYYGSNPQLYADTAVDNDFLRALAYGGFQVGALARLYHPGGILVEEHDPEMALAKTAELLQTENITLFEAAFASGPFFIRVDILVKKGKELSLYEVKAKSFAEGTDHFMGKKQLWLTKEWVPYVYDVAFQHYVLSHASPDCTVSAHLTLVNKTQVATIEGLNQKFLLQEENGRRQVVVKGKTDPASLGAPLLVNKNVDGIIIRIMAGTDQANSTTGGFERNLHAWANAYAKNIRLPHPIGGNCGKCSFQASAQQQEEGQLSGFEQCWREQANFTPEDFLKPSVLRIWRYLKKDDAIANGRYFQEQLTRVDFEPKKSTPITSIGWSKIDRQELQAQLSKGNNKNHRLHQEALRDHLEQWIFPLHFIDFETTTVAIPFNKGRRPYEQVAFQFSHHVVEQDGSVRHAGQWINTQPGVFPNYEFVRNLKAQLEGDNGTIFRYAAHENTVLNAIITQLSTSVENDREELITWIKTITTSTVDNISQWAGARNMVDLLEIVLTCYYHPETNGSNSLKYVLPATVNSSKYLQEKYGKADYGQVIPSLNFSGHQWLRKEEGSGKILNPYKTLPMIHEGIDNESLDELLMDESSGIMDGGAAMTAYARMQFTEMSDTERQRVTDALLRYCELDTLAMVMLYEAWREWCG